MHSDNRDTQMAHTLAFMHIHSNAIRKFLLRYLHLRKTRSDLVARSWSSPLDKNARCSISQSRTLSESALRLLGTILLT